MNLVIDASVFVSALTPAEANSAISKQFLFAVAQSNAGLFCPTLVLVECAAGIARPTGNMLLASQSNIVIANMARMNLVPLTDTRGISAAQIAIQCRLRGADAVYVAVAAEFGATLITWDTEVLSRGTSAASTMTPADWLAQNPPPVP